MALTTKDFTTVVRDTVTAIQGKAASLVDLRIGSILRALVESAASLVLFLQGLILQLLAITRAATSSGKDLDSWMADYGLTRLPAKAASGVVTFSRFTSTSQASIAVGSIVQTGDGSVQYAVIADTTNALYFPALNAFIIPAGQASGNITVVASTLGSAGNAQIGMISQLYQPIPYIDTVNNAAAFINGADAETDTAFRTRFQSYIANLSKATKGAVLNAVLNYQQGVSENLVENQTYGGAAQLGYFYVVVDDGSGSPPSAFLNGISAAIDLIRPFTVAFGVFAPVKTLANVSATYTSANGYDHTVIANAMITAITNYLNSLQIGQALNWSRLFQVAYGASPGVQSISVLTINGGTTDIAGVANNVIKAGTVTVT